MAYHFSDVQLRVFKKYCRQDRNKDFLSNSRIIILEHILPTTECMINILSDNGAEIFAIVAKPYSIDKEVFSRLGKEYKIILESYSNLECTDVLDKLLRDAILASQADKKNIIILDVGGYFASPLCKLTTDDLQYVWGVVEDTTFGHNRYCKIINDVPVPVFSVARSDLKEIEAHFVGRDAVLAMETVLRSVGIMLSGRHGLVIGYGMIGKNVAIALRNSDLKVSVYDVHDHKNLQAYIDGFNIHKKKELLKSADIIFFATGNPEGALSFDEIEECKNNVILASAGSKDTEFDVQSIKTQSDHTNKIGDYLTEYILSNDKHIIVAKEGTAVNFLLPSLSVEVLDLVFSEILLCMLMLLKKHNEIPLHTINTISNTYLNEISKDWLRIVNN